MSINKKPLIAVAAIGFAFLFVTAAQTASQPPSPPAAASPPCETTFSENDFRVSYDGFNVLAVDHIMAEPGDNICSIFMDTNKGRVKYVFTVVKAVNGEFVPHGISLKPVR